MSKKPIQPQDKYVLRLPDGLRDRIKAKASEMGRSMNTEIVRVLEREFPEPVKLDAQLKHLLDLFTALRKVRGYDGAISGITDAVRETVDAIANGHASGVDAETRRRVRSAMDDWHSQQLKDEKERREIAELRYLQSQEEPSEIDFPDIERDDEG